MIIWKIFWKSIQEACRGKIWKWLIGSVSALAFVLTFGKNYLNARIEISILIGIGILAFLFIFRLVSRLSINAIKHLHDKYREAVYGDAIILLKDAFAKVHALRKREVFDDKEFMAAMITFCDTLKTIFDKKTSANCGVSIKVATSGSVSAQASVHNLCRDTKSRSRDTDAYKNINHTILGNTPYTKILNSVTKGKKQFYYINNDISSNGDYENTSLDAYESCLPYSSELVVALIPAENESSTNYEVLGFLCIDCDKKNKFDNRYDVAIVEGVADGIYDLIVARNNFNAKSKTTYEAA
jgi:hypothetical protein